MSSPAITVILPIYNGADYLHKSIQSVLNQTFTDFEFLICDDGSRDKSLEISRSFQDDRIRIMVNEQNKGLFFTLNKLIKSSISPLIKLWSQDDIMRPSCLEDMKALHDRLPDIAMSYCAYDVIDEQGKLTAKTKHDTTPELILPQLASSIMFYHGSITGNIANVMLKRIILEKIGGFDESLKVSGDFDLWVRITEHHAIGRVKDPLIDLRNHAQQFSRLMTSMIHFAVENEPIIDTLYSRIPAEQKTLAREYRRRHHYVLLFHGAVYALAHRDIKTSGQILQIISKRESPTRIFLIWLLSINGRFFQISTPQVQ